MRAFRDRYSRLAGGRGRLLLVRAWIAGVLSQIVDTVLFISIAFYGVTDQASGQPMPIGAIMEGQIISKLVLSTLVVPPGDLAVRQIGTAAGPVS